jgi:hypothetical protein
MSFDSRAHDQKEGVMKGFSALVLGAGVFFLILVYDMPALYAAAWAVGALLVGLGTLKPWRSPPPAS